MTAWEDRNPSYAELRAEVKRLRAEIERLRAALTDARDALHNDFEPANDTLDGKYRNGPVAYDDVDAV